MTERLNVIVQALRQAFVSPLRRLASATGGGARRTAAGIAGARGMLLGVALVGASGWALYRFPPVQTVAHGEIGVRGNHWTGQADLFREGTVWVLPGLHDLRRLSLRDQVYRPPGSARADGEAPFQSIEGLSLGVDLTVRYALDPGQAARIARSLPDDVDAQIVEPAVQGVIYPVFTRYTVREIFSSRRAEIQQTIERDLKAKLAADGITLRSVQMGKVDLPADYRAGMDRLLAEELATEKMRYTLELKDKRVQESALDAEAEKVRREKAAEAAGNEQIIAARAQSEAMKHVLPFKHKQIVQRRLEAEAEKQARIKSAEGSAQARRIEAAGEADSRQKLADAEAYRQERIGRIASEQMERDGAVISRHPLLIQKTMADKLSDKVQVIIAPPGDGGFLGANLLGTSARANAPQAVATGTTP